MLKIRTHYVDWEISHLLIHQFKQMQSKRVIAVKLKKKQTTNKQQNKTNHTTTDTAAVFPWTVMALATGKVNGNRSNCMTYMWPVKIHKNLKNYKDILKHYSYEYLIYKWPSSSKNSLFSREQEIITVSLVFCLTKSSVLQ